MDLCGPISPTSRGGNLYFLKIINGFSKYCFIYPMCRKSDTFCLFTTFMNMAENISGCKVHSIVSSNGGEFINANFIKLVMNKGIQHLTTAPYSPQQNPFAERGNRTTVEKARALLACSGLPLEWWGEAVSTAVHLENCTPDSSIGFNSPYSCWHGTTPNLEHLQPFGCRSVLYLEKHRCNSKFDLPGVEAIFLGFYPSQFPQPSDTEASRPLDNSLFDFGPVEGVPPSNVSLEDAAVTQEDNLEAVKNRFEDLELGSDTPIESPQSSVVDSDNREATPPPGRGYSYVPASDNAPCNINLAIDTANILSERRRPRAMVVGRHTANVIVGEPASIKDPKTYGDILGRLNKEHWLMAVQTEINNIERHKVWVVAPLTPGVKPLDTTWVFKRKFDANGDLLKYKARLCVRGFWQIEGIDYNATFAPTGRLLTLRIILGLGALLDFDIQQMDVKCAFLNGVPDEDLFIKVPEGVGIELPPGHGLQLQKSLYGLKQSPRCWYRSLKEFFTSINFKAATMDPCLFIHQDKAKFCCVYIHVDNLVIVGPEVQFLKDKIKGRFEMEDLGECQWVLGMRVSRDQHGRTITLSQDCYVREILEEFGMLDCRPVSAPLPSDVTTCPVDNTPPDLSFNFRRGVGLLNYLVQCSRPDLAFACSHLSQFLN